MQILSWVSKFLLLSLFLDVVSPLSLAQTISPTTDPSLLRGGQGRVTGLVLQGSARESGIYMRGTLSPALGSLAFLEVMVISGMKHIAGPIPESFSGLTRLAQLVLEDNSLEGNIPPGLGRLPSLSTLSLNGNHLRGQIPPSLGNFKKLQQLSLARNLLSDILGHFQNLTFIDLSNNQLSGLLPASLFSLVKLQDLSLDHNQLAGRIPNQIAGLKSLTRLSLSSNGLTGRGLPSLLSVDLSNNHLSLGTVPGWIKDRELSDVHLAGCGIAGFFTNMSNLQKLKLSNNQLKFDLSEIKLPDGTSSIELQSNQLSGLLSRILNNRTSSFLEVLDVSGNQISGTIPEFVEGIELEGSNHRRQQDYGSVPWFNLKPERTGEDRYFKEPDNRHHSDHLGALVESSMARPFYQQPHREKSQLAC
ncbi:hypothetical protein OIU84_030295 [Salix udensis]|uniref:Uncharacterized protein n=1 Tax=Salix udensis TaxID=889485 RepID=A0AAD6KDD8_9ROSI|nr:hypothetical protein OIU84_030295 [Salix udensis]